MLLSETIVQRLCWVRVDDGHLTNGYLNLYPSLTSRTNVGLMQQWLT